MAFNIFIRHARRHPPSLSFRGLPFYQEGERKEVPPELQAKMDGMSSLSVGETEFFDLKQPMIRSPK
jgi:hypothetical protein